MNSKKSSIKINELRKHKAIATSLFLLMMLLYIFSIYAIKNLDLSWINYLKAFSEAAMVGALADWFAVTALFHYPMGIKIPHTNLIENSKAKIGENLGEFVVSNFLNASTIRPYIEKMNLTDFLIKWMHSTDNLNIITKEIVLLFKRVLISVDDKNVECYIDKKLIELLKGLQFQTIVSKGIHIMSEKGDIDKALTYLVKNTHEYIQNHAEIIKDRVKEESHFLIPGFVDQIIARKITDGFSRLLSEIEMDIEHPIRKDIHLKINKWLLELETDKQWELKFQQLKNNLINNINTSEYAVSIWQNIKNTTLSQIEKEDNAILVFVKRCIEDAITGIKNDTDFHNKINSWFRFAVYKYSIRNSNKIADLITSTIGNWEGKALSEKLELEVGKDLQFIRINGTIVGGIVGLIIYYITQLF